MVFNKNLQLSLIMILLFALGFLMVAIYSDWLNLSFRVNGLFFTHWLSWIGALFISIYTPIFYITKRLYPIQVNKLLNIHVFGNLLAFLLISTHFAGQVGRPLQFYPEGRTGVALFVITLLTVASGIVHRYNLIPSFGRFEVPKRNRFVHVSLSLSFYIVIVVHVLHNIGYL